MSQAETAPKGKRKPCRKMNKKLRRQVRVLMRSRKEILEEAVAVKALLHGPPHLSTAVVENIAEHLARSASYRTLATLSMASKATYESVKPVLYRRVVWDSNKHWRKMFPSVKKKFRPREVPAGWRYIKQLIVEINIWNIISHKQAMLFPNLDIAIIKHEIRANVCFCHSPSSATFTSDQIVGRHDFICDIDILHPVDKDTLPEILTTPLRWACGDRTMLHSINTVATVHVAIGGSITSRSSSQDVWIPPVPAQHFQLAFDASHPSDGLFDTMKYFCGMIRPAKRWVEYIGGGPADCTLRLFLSGGLDIYCLFSRLLEEILSRNLVVRVVIDLGLQRTRIPPIEFREIMVEAAKIYHRLWPHITQAYNKGEPRNQFYQWTIFSIAYAESGTSADGRRCEYGSYGQITTMPASSTFTLDISHGSRPRGGYNEQYHSRPSSSATLD